MFLQTSLTHVYIYIKIYSFGSFDQKYKESPNDETHTFFENKDSIMLDMNHLAVKDFEYMNPGGISNGSSCLSVQSFVQS